MKIVDEKQYLELSLKFEMRIVKVYEDHAVVKLLSRIDNVFITR